MDDQKDGSDAQAGEQPIGVTLPNNLQQTSIATPSQPSQPTASAPQPQTQTPVNSSEPVVPKPFVSDTSQQNTITSNLVRKPNEELITTYSKQSEVAKSDSNSTEAIVSNTSTVKLDDRSIEPPIISPTQHNRESLNISQAQEVQPIDSSLEQTQSQTQIPTASPVKEHKTDILGIVSIVLAVLQMTLPGLIVGIVGLVKAKKAGYSKVLSIVGIILNIFIAIIGIAVILFLVLVIFPASAKVANDLLRSTQANYIVSTSEAIKSETGVYPTDCSQIEQYVKERSNFSVSSDQKSSSVSLDDSSINQGANNSNTPTLSTPGSNGKSACVTSGVPSATNDVLLYTVFTLPDGTVNSNVSYWSEYDSKVKQAR